ncbi:cysteinyl-tRNA synthetase [Thecamonas trahens ATCC 50062]|uniref:Cysteinyl-tRNA synthetase n=1 Tax=Thecamonas trahens ATCC 50062 TaxID=461836 RepID=A0A0L0D8S1_THETB|nr:cysteinyl-tRNA synthetase [Thecamonas trahens ATCC 50062]KNC48777.1 cysteinyl-tRNA synthetase [Thecamonas trahens ATCC 50062]|eukprot:XP_013762828.1 cysteinyl-tRNA synthetase [Thecamonas trahens ATCC 50062]
MHPPVPLRGADKGVDDGGVKDETVVPVCEPGAELSWYTCGPTVYAPAHLGHGWTYVHVDLMQRMLGSLFGVRITSVRNVTDIDDKIIARAAELDIGHAELAADMEASFNRDMAGLGVAPPHAAPRVTDAMPTIVAFIADLVARGAAYVDHSSGSVYFDTETYGDAYPAAMFKASAGLSGCRHGIGGGGDDDGDSDSAQAPGKRAPADFALWKGDASPAAVAWPAPWGPGRPGWHIECSAMATAQFGATLDVHAGGIDLKFPHHTNEIAQCLAWLDAPRDKPTSWARLFAHISHLHIDGAKMSKSLKNFITVSDVLENGAGSGDHFRLFAALHPRSAPCAMTADVAAVFAEARAIEAQLLATLAPSAAASHAVDVTHVDAALDELRTAWAHLAAPSLDARTLVDDARNRVASIDPTGPSAEGIALVSALDALGFRWQATVQGALDDCVRAELVHAMAVRRELRSALVAKSADSVTGAVGATAASLLGMAPPASIGAGWALCDALRDDIQAKHPLALRC